MDTWRNVVLQHVPEFGHAPKWWGLADAATQLGALLWHAAQAGDGARVQRVARFLAWAEEQGERQEGLAWLCEDVLRRTVGAAHTRAVFAAELDEHTLHRLRRAIEFLTSREVAAEVERGVLARVRGAPPH